MLIWRAIIDRAIFIMMANAMTMRRRNKLNEELFAGSGSGGSGDDGGEEEVVAAVEWKLNPEEEY